MSQAPKFTSGWVYVPNNSFTLNFSCRLSAFSFLEKHKPSNPCHQTSYKSSEFWCAPYCLSLICPDHCYCLKDTYSSQGPCDDRTQTGLESYIDTYYYSDILENALGTKQGVLLPSYRGMPKMCIKYLLSL